MQSNENKNTNMSSFENSDKIQNAEGGLIAQFRIMNPHQSLRERLHTHKVVTKIPLFLGLLS